MKINKHFHTKHGKKRKHTRSLPHACAHTHTQGHTHTMTIKSARAAAHTRTHMAEKDMGGGG